MRMKHLDLNLLVALDALLSKRSVTEAANFLHVTQPAMSASLAKLRRHFDDPLLVKVGRGLEPTALAEQLAVPLRLALDSVEQAIDMRPSFDPAVSRHHFKICASEFTASTLLVPVLARLEHIAPQVTVELLPWEPAVSFDRGWRNTLDFLFVSERFARQDSPWQLVIEDPLSCVVWTGNHQIGRTMSREQYLALHHVVMRYGFERSPGFEQWTLDQLKLHRRESISCATPALLGALVAGTQRIATLPSRMARLLAAQMPLKVLAPPIELPPLKIVMQWNQARDLDPPTSWFRQLVVESAEQRSREP